AIPPALLKKAATEVGLPKLQAVAADSKLPGELAFLKANASTIAKVSSAAAKTPGQWQTWFWVCVGGVVAFILLIFTMVGRWDPRKAKADQVAHDQAVQAEMARLATGTPASAPAVGGAGG
ncbi:MAG: hypothetical protein ACRDZY_18310, partial [Acidimicrobiales bacterium]